MTMSISKTDDFKLLLCLIDNGIIIRIEKNTELCQVWVT
jgi:hypothetical protein